MRKPVLFLLAALAIAVPALAQIEVLRIPPPPAPPPAEATTPAEPAVQATTEAPSEPSRPVMTIVPRMIATPKLQQSAIPPLTFDVANDPERARALINRLRGKNRELRGQMALTLADLQALRTQLDEMTSRGGSLVMAQCVSRTLSRRTDGSGEENCAASGYICGEVEGTCMRQCTSSTQCTGDFRCHPVSHRCELNPPDTDE